MQVPTVVTLTDREEDFLMQLARGIKPTRSAINAGFAGPSARNLLAKPHIAAAIRTICANLNAVVRRIDSLSAE